MKIVKSYHEFVVNEEAEGQMYRTKLENIVNNAQELLNHINNDDDLEAWIQDKITIAEHNMDAILGYMQSNKKAKNGSMPNAGKQMGVTPKMPTGSKLIFDKKK
ncbi:hypothetical protein EBU94_00375 [bacterium]|nr:hypothetical protein [bacterium]